MNPILNTLSCQAFTLFTGNQTYVETEHIFQCARRMIKIDPKVPQNDENSIRSRCS